jgi:hypothetical protein
MLAVLRDIRTNSFRGVQATFLTVEGRKHSAVSGGSRRTHGAPIGAVCKLSPDEEVTTALAIAEGVETALSMALLPECFGIPVWATIGENTLADFPVPAGVEVLWIGVDVNDPKSTGEKAAHQCADRWLAAGREVFFVKPLGDAKADLNDVVMGWRRDD